MLGIKYFKISSYFKLQSLDVSTKEIYIEEHNTPSYCYTKVLGETKFIDITGHLKYLNFKAT